MPSNREKVNRYIRICIAELYAKSDKRLKISKRIDTQLAIDTLNMAVAGRNKSEGVIFHTDRGCQFTSQCFRKHWDVLGMIQSFLKKGHPYDNAVMECFFKYLKRKKQTDELMQILRNFL